MERKRYTFKELILATKPSKLILSIALLFSVITTLVGLIIPLFTKQLVDGFSLSSITVGEILIFASIFIGQALTNGISIYLLNYSGLKVVSEMRKMLWEKLLSLTVSFYDKNQTGDTVSRMSNDTAILKNLITEHVPNFVTGVISIIGAIIILLLMDWKMTLLMLVAVPITLFILMPLGRQMYRISKGLQDETAAFTGQLSQTLSEMRLVKSYNAEQQEFDKGDKKIQSLFTYGMKETKVHALLSPLIFLVMMVVLVMIIGYGGMRVSKGALSAGELVAFILYLFQIVMPLTSLSTFFTQLQKAKGATQRIIDILAEESEDQSGKETVDVLDQPISVNDVSFSYNENQPILKSLSFIAKPGTVTAFVGPSGGGKTTFFALLERYYQPTSGEILVGKTPLEAFDLACWRKQIGYVSQESPIVAGSILDNLTYGLSRDVTEDEVMEAVKMAYADEFIEALPEGVLTQVGERGVKLSGGQRQRIGIARALLRNPKILMLDEATSNLDSKSEIVVQKALQNLMRGRTTFVIAHRLSTIVDADQLLFLEKGHITGIGTHQELFQKHTLYREFASQQFKVDTGE